MYIYLLKEWPLFTWNSEAILLALGEVRNRQGRILGQMNELGFKIQETAMLNTLTLDVTKSSEIEGERLNEDQVRSSIARRLGIDIGGTITTYRNVDGVVEMMLDATQHYKEPLTEERLFNWHGALFPTGRSGLHKITVGHWRKSEGGPIQVVSRPMGKEKAHFEAPDADCIPKEMEVFLNWFNRDGSNDPMIKAAIAHLWFVTIHPFDDGNGRITRALTDMLLARSDGSPQRFYSMSAQILLEKGDYYSLLEYTQKGSLDITRWISWFLDCLYHSMNYAEQTLSAVLDRKLFWKKHREIVLNNRQRQMIELLMDNFFGKLTTTKWAKMTKSSTDTTLRDIQDLIDKNILEKEQGGGRNTNYSIVLPKL